MLPSVDVLGFVAFETLKVSVPTLIEAARGRVTVEVCNERLWSWAAHLIAQAKIDIELTGQENIRSGESYVVMSNHQSHYDIPVLFHALGIPLRMVAKKELFQIPVMSQAMRVAGFVEVDRKNRQRAIDSLARVRERLPQALSIWIAPEGTRSSSGKLAPFKKGGFHLALATGFRILPVTIVGTREVLPARGMKVTRGKTVHVTIGVPIDPKQYGPERREELMQVVRGAIERPLPPEFQGET